jgi:hypothetical protein
MVRVFKRRVGSLAGRRAPTLGRRVRSGAVGRTRNSPGAGGSRRFEVLLPRLRQPGLLAEIESRCAAAGVRCEVRAGDERSSNGKVLILTVSSDVSQHAFATLSRWIYVRVGTRPYDPGEPASEAVRHREAIATVQASSAWTSQDLEFIVGRIVRREFLGGIGSICAAHNTRLIATMRVRVQANDNRDQHRRGPVGRRRRVPTIPRPANRPLLLPAWERAPGTGPGDTLASSDAPAPPSRAALLHLPRCGSGGNRLRCHRDVLIGAGVESDEGGDASPWPRRATKEFPEWILPR